MLSKYYAILNISKKKLPSCFGIKIRQISLLSLLKNRTSDFKNTLDYNYLGPKHSKFLVHVFGCVPL